MTATMPVTVSGVQTWFYMQAYVKKSSPGSTQLPTSRHLLSPFTATSVTYIHTRINRLWSPLAYGLGGNKWDYPALPVDHSTYGFELLKLKLVQGKEWLSKRSFLDKFLQAHRRETSLAESRKIAEQGEIKVSISTNMKTCLGRTHWTLVKKRNERDGSEDVMPSWVRWQDSYQFSCCWSPQEWASSLPFYLDLFLYKDLEMFQKTRSDYLHVDGPFCSDRKTEAVVRRRVLNIPEEKKLNEEPVDSWHESFVSKLVGLRFLADIILLWEMQQGTLNYHY